MDEKTKKATLASIALTLLVMLTVVAVAQTVLASSADISEEEAKQIAEEETGGIAGDVTTEKEDGRLVYEVQVETDSGPAEVEIDANTGEVLEVEKGKDND
ncbi:MAG: PepSY domain-containing protein [Thermoplasmata archaeon]|nr:MAG: PepSY domain-containing protein [Thermoplasmata archaeon]